MGGLHAYSITQQINMQVLSKCCHLRLYMNRHNKKSEDFGYRILTIKANFLGKNIMTRCYYLERAASLYLLENNYSIISIFSRIEKK